MTAQPRHFIDLTEFSPATLRGILERAHGFKSGEIGDHPLTGKTLALIFEKPSTRTRVSFEVGMKQLGGHVVVLNAGEMQIGRGESIADTARVLSRYVDAVMIRTNAHETLAEFAHFATVPVINGLTDRSHPCQVMADVMTFEEARGPISGKRVAWSGDGNNVATSWIHAAAQFGFELRLACPAERAPAVAAIAWAREHGASIVLTTSPVEAVADADCVVTDTWVSMGEQPTEHRHNLLAPYRVDSRLMANAHKDAVFMHCLPAHRGEEVTADVIDGQQSVVFQEAENRLHAQKGILSWCMG